MDNRRHASDFQGDNEMNYISRLLDHYSPRRPHAHPHSSHPAHNSSRPKPDNPRRQHHKRKHHNPHKMTSFNGPWSKDLETLKKSIQSIPSQYKSSFASASKSTLEKISNSNAVHVWESDSDIDNLLQLTSVIAKLCDLGMRKEKGYNAKDGAMLIIAEEKSGRNNFARICQLVAYLTDIPGKKHLDGTVGAFGKIVVVRGWDNSITSGQKEALDKTVKRINTTLERVLTMHTGKKEVVWHQGAILSFLLHWINSTTSTLRSSLSAITITSALNLSNGIAPSQAGRANSPADLERLANYAKKLSIPVVFLDSASQLINAGLTTYMYFHAYYIHTLLPTSLINPHMSTALDELVTFAFRLWGASHGTYGSGVVKMVKTHLDAGKARAWAKKCVDSASYEKSDCRAAGREQTIHAAVTLADAPFITFNHTDGEGRECVPVPSFARLFVGPAAPATVTSTSYIAAPTHFSFKDKRFRIAHPAPFHILIPSPDQDEDKITNHIQGLMMAVLERVRQEKGQPVSSEEEKGVWEAVVKACMWAIKACEGKMPKGVAEKVKYVDKKLRKGCWGLLYDEPKGGGGDGGKGGGSGNATAIPEPNRTYGFGQGVQQTMGGFEFAAQHQHGAVPVPVPQSASMRFAPQVLAQAPGHVQGMQIDPAMYAQAAGRSHAGLPSPVGYGNPALNAGFTSGQRAGGAYPQSMGGPW